MRISSRACVVYDSQLDYGYDANGNRTSSTINVDTTFDHKNYYVYDALNRTTYLEQQGRHNVLTCPLRGRGLSFQDQVIEFGTLRATIERRQAVLDYSKYIGMDVHKDTISVAISQEGQGELRFYGRIRNSPEAIGKLIKKVCPGGEVMLF